MQLIEMTISGDFVRLLYGDGATKEESTEWCELKMRAPAGDNRRLGAAQKDALLRVQALIAAEMTRFRMLSDQIP